MLQTLREETKSVSRQRNEVEQEALDAYENIEEVESEVIGDEAPGFPSKPVRQTSKTLLELMHRHDPDLQCERRSDTACLVMYVKKNVKEFDFGNSESDLDTMKEWLEKLATIVNHIHPSSSSLRNYFTELTAIFKKYLVAEGENDKSGDHVTIICRVLTAPGSRVREVLHAKEQVLRSKLADMFHEKWADVDRFCR